MNLTEPLQNPIPLSLLLVVVVCFVFLLVVLVKIPAVEEATCAWGSALVSCPRDRAGSREGRGLEVSRPCPRDPGMDPH